MGDYNFENIIPLRNKYFTEISGNNVFCKLCENNYKKKDYNEHLDKCCISYIYNEIKDQQEYKRNAYSEYLIESENDKRYMSMIEKIKQMDILLNYYRNIITKMTKTTIEINFKILSLNQKEYPIDVIAQILQEKIYILLAKEICDTKIKIKESFPNLQENTLVTLGKHNLFNYIKGLCITRTFNYISSLDIQLFSEFSQIYHKDSILFFKIKNRNFLQKLRPMYRESFSIDDQENMIHLLKTHDSYGNQYKHPVKCQDVEYEWFLKHYADDNIQHSLNRKRGYTFENIDVNIE